MTAEPRALSLRELCAELGLPEPTSTDLAEAALRVEIARLRAQVAALQTAAQKFDADYQYALRPYNGTGYHDMDGRSTHEVIDEIAEAVAAWRELRGGSDG